MKSKHEQIQVMGRFDKRIKLTELPTYGAISGRQIKQPKRHFISTEKSPVRNPFEGDHN